jgi:hypothetical protein
MRYVISKKLLRNGETKFQYETWVWSARGEIIILLESTKKPTLKDNRLEVELKEGGDVNFSLFFGDSVTFEGENIPS